MLATEKYCVELGFSTAYLTTHDKQIFYSRCGYKFSESVCAFGGSSTLNLGKFAKNSAAQTPPSPSLNGSTPRLPAPPPPGAPLPPGPPPPPPPPVSKVSSPSVSSVVSSPSPDLVLLCAKAFSQPSLPAAMPFIENVPEIDMSLRNEKNNEDCNEKMFMKKSIDVDN